MGIFATVVKRLYVKGKVTKEEVAARVETGSITAEEYKEITNETYEGKTA